MGRPSPPLPPWETRSLLSAPMSDLREITQRYQSFSSLPPAHESSQVIHSSPISPIVSQITRPHGNISFSRVSLGYFDEEDVSQLWRTLTHFSESARVPETALSSSETLSVPVTGPFDFEKALRTIIKMYVVASARTYRFPLLNGR